MSKRKERDLTNMTGDEIKTFRSDFKLSQNDFAKLLGVTQGAIVWWETHQRKVPETTARTLLLFRKWPQLMEHF